MGLVGQRLKELREEKGLSQDALGKLVNLSQQTIGHYEVGRSDPDTKTLELFAEIFETSTDYLLGRSSNKLSSSSPDAHRLDDILRGLEPEDRKTVENLIAFLKSQRKQKEQ